MDTLVRETFENLLYEHIGKHLKSETEPKIEQRVNKVPCPIPYLDRMMAIFKDYPSVSYNLREEKVQDKYTFLYFLEEYLANDTTRKAMYEQLWDRIYQFRNDLWDEWGENILSNDLVTSTWIFDFDFDMFPEAKKYCNQVTYLMFETMVSDKVKEIIHQKLETDYEIHHVEVKSPFLDIDGLSYVVIKDTPMELRYESYCRAGHLPPLDEKWFQLFKELMSIRIPVCAYIDKHGEVKLMHTYAWMKGDSQYKQGWRKDLQTVFLSSWEANIARILSSKNIKWEYESTRFELKTHSGKNETENYTYYYSYTPDFILEDGSILEIKGIWDQNSLEVVSCFQLEYPEKPYYIIDGDMYATLEKLYSKVLPNWEKTKKIRIGFQGLIPLVGITQPERVEFVRKLKLYDHIQLVRDKNNAYDRNAIQVQDLQGNLLGYVAKQWASVYAHKLDLGMEFEATVREIKPKVINITVTRINIDQNIIYPFLLP